MHGEKISNLGQGSQELLRSWEGDDLAKVNLENSQRKRRKTELSQKPRKDDVSRRMEWLTLSNVAEKSRNLQKMTNRSGEVTITKLYKNT